ncbi:MAG: NADH-quinone oxidoreductase subunit C [Bacteroidetes bacterium]|nr:NADH-quinone oxidoreductase subunit C [Bacteroidota bacterium]
MKSIETGNNPSSVRLTNIPVLDYEEFFSQVDELMQVESNHCLNYFAVSFDDHYRFICCIGCDEKHTIILFSHEQPKTKEIRLKSITPIHFQFHVFEREIAENFGIVFTGHPWLKPVRYAFDRASTGMVMDNYPFFSIDSEELHEVGVGPVHAGIIEPGHFRFICNGEKVLHLEIQLGYQHRGIERLFVEKPLLIQKAILSESIAGDTAIGHSLCHTGLIEVLGGLDSIDSLSAERIIALEFERIAVHIGDTAALCTDIGYQFGQVVNEALRTIIINTTQLWCGNRFGKGLIRAGGTHYPLTKETLIKMKGNLDEVMERYLQITERIFSMSSVLGRFETIGKVTLKQALRIGAVGMAARSSGLKRDIRWSHPFGMYNKNEFDPVTLQKGDVWSRAMLRKQEVERSVAVIHDLIKLLHGDVTVSPPVNEPKLQPGSFAISLTEGWRGEICHTAITDKEGRIIHYKVKDPSFHNWMALALAVRGQEISDFPLCNKSFNLSYCGNDL